MRLFVAALLMVGILLTLLVLACATAMRSVGGCSKLPTVEECNRAARYITNECLRMCVVGQCSGVSVRCGDPYTLRGCGQPRKGGQLGGFTALNDGASCEIPLDELHWCDLPVRASCRPYIMVHELAHTCGWDHEMGMGVLGNDGQLSGSAECE